MKPLAARSLVLASGNAGKLSELRALLADGGFAVHAQSDFGVRDVEETAATFVENALLKARHAARSTGLPALGDDSGLCVDALNGMPGVLSARWAGPPRPGLKEQADERNNELLLAQLADVPDERRGAHFACAVAFCHPGGEEVVHGRMPGHVIRDQRGSGGFGYDVLFVADEHSSPGTDPELTSAELTPEEKDRISHRGRALREIAPRVAQVLRGR